MRHPRTQVANETTSHEEKEVLSLLYQNPTGDFPGGPVVKNSPASAGAWVRSLVWEDPTDSLAHVQSRPTLWDPLDCSLPDSSVHRFVQARMLG